MKGVWGISVGYKVPDPSMTLLHKTLGDYQVLSGEDCHNELFLASQGHVVYNCCPEGYTKTEILGKSNCCPPGYNIRNSDGLCVSSIAPYITVSPSPCPCCPAGYVWDNSINLCRGSKASDTVPAVSCGYICINGSGVQSPLTACTALEPDSILISAPVPDSCYNPAQGVTWCNVEPPVVVVNRTIQVQGADISIHQFTVGDTNGPVAGGTVFIPMVGGVAYLKGKTTIEVAQLMVLTLNVDYTFNSATGGITLQLGRIFNAGEVYTITAF